MHNITFGYSFGNFPWVKEHLDMIIWAMFLLHGLEIAAEALRNRLRISHG